MSLSKKIFQKASRYFSKEQKELRRLLSLPRYKPCKTWLLGGIELADPVSFVAGYDEIIQRENYFFTTPKPSPFIIDCGSNIGLSIIYFKKLFPNSKIIAFEPDPGVFRVLEHNISALSLGNVQLNNKAVAGRPGTLPFQSEGGFSGRLTNPDVKEGANIVNVVAEQLSGYIDQPVDFLKIDIEGAEWEVLKEIEPKLNLVDRIFIEYHSIDGKEQPLDLILALLKKNGFRIHIKEAFSARHPFEKLPLVEGMDNQLEIYAWKH